MSEFSCMSRVRARYPCRTMRPRSSERGQPERRRVEERRVRTEGGRTTHDLLLRVFGARNEVDGLHVPDVDLVAENVGEDHLGKVLLLLVAIEISLWRRGRRKAARREMDGKEGEVSVSSFSFHRAGQYVQRLQYLPLNFPLICASSLLTRFSSSSLQTEQGGGGARERERGEGEQEDGKKLGQRGIELDIRAPFEPESERCSLT